MLVSARVLASVFVSYDAGLMSMTTEAIIGSNGIWLSVTAAEVLSLVVTIIMLSKNKIIRCKPQAD